MSIHSSENSLKVGIYGSWRHETIAVRALEWAHGLGHAIGTMGHVLVTGGSGGVLLEARRGCKEAGGWNVGIIPENGLSADVERRALIDVTIPTGQGALGRMAILTQTVDLAFAVGGGGGTLAEVTMTYLQRKLVIVIDRLQRDHDPDFLRLLSRRTELRIGDVEVVQGWMDSKPASMVSPIYVINSSVAPQEAMSVALALFDDSRSRSACPSVGGPLDE